MRGAAAGAARRPKSWRRRRARGRGGGGRRCLDRGRLGWRGLRRLRPVLVDVGEHVLAGDPPAGAGAGDRARVEAVLVHQAAHHRRQQPVVGTRGRGLGRPGPGPAEPAAAGGAGASTAGAAAGGPAAAERAGAGAVAGGGAGTGASAAGAAGASSAGAARARRRSRGLGRRWGLRRRSRRLGRRNRRCFGRRRAVADDRDDGTDRHGVALVDLDLEQGPGDRATGTSVSTLSVDTSNSGSSATTVSPTALNHFVMVPSVTVSPSWGRVTSAIRRSGSFR